MDALIRMIRSDFEETYAGAPSYEAVEAFVRRAFAARNVQPTDTLVDQLTRHLLHDTPIDHLKGFRIKHCGE